MSCKRYGRWAISLAALLALVLAAGSAPAMVAPGGQTTYEIPLKQFNLYTYSSPATELARQETEQAFHTAFGGLWKVYTWNPQTNTPAYVYGSGVQVSPSFGAAIDVERASDRLVSGIPPCSRRS